MRKRQEPLKIIKAAMWYSFRWKKGFFDMQELAKWFLTYRRALPWRENKTPYRVWISEVMLQQTQVSVVIPYFLKWMGQFPTLESLANAPEEDVIKAWEGLGYYSRARNLHKAAKIILSEHQGVIPSTEKELAALPGFGPYTVGAVMSFAFYKKKTAVDGNVIRVLSRYFASLQDCSDKKHYEELTSRVLPDHEPWVVMEGLIELGATVCKKVPECVACPLQLQCKAYQEEAVLQFPRKKKALPSISLKRYVHIICYENKVLVKKEEEKKVMSGLYEFPYSEDPLAFPFAPSKVCDLKMVKHSFTRYQVTLYPSIYYLSQSDHPFTGYDWHELSHLTLLPFSSGHKRVMLDVLSYFRLLVSK